MAFRSDLDALILGVLRRGDMHGYEISRRINEGGEGNVQVKEAQLYPLLHRLESEGMIEAHWLPQEGKPSRKIYRLTEEGKRALEAKRSAWESFAKSISSILDPQTEASHG